jgi:hypothetical protein
VRNFARTLSSPLDPHVASARGRTLAMALAAIATVVAMMLVAPPARAVVAEAGGVKVGLQPRLTSKLTPGEEPLTFKNEAGNVVLHGTSDYAIYWDPNQPTEFTHEWITNIDEFFYGLGEAHLDTPFATLGQYRDRGNTTTPFKALSKGAYSDTTKFPSQKKCTDPKNSATRCLTDAQLREQLQSFISAHGLPTGMGTVYFLLTPPETTVCLEEASLRCSDYSLSGSEETKHERKSTSYKESFCSYHSYIDLDGAPEGDGSTILYAAIPWVANTGAYDCQDGGWNPEGHKPTDEAPPILTTKEEEAREKALGEMPAKQKEAAEAERRLEGPHIEEPNQGGTEESDTHTAGLTDILVDQISEEEMNTVTDPLLNSWHDAQGNEATDMCRDIFAATAGEGGSEGEISGSVKAQPTTEAGTLANVSLGSHRYYINNVFGLAREECSGGVGLVARFTPPNPLNADEPIAVDGMESTISLDSGDAFGPSGPPSLTYATFSWNFGDGTPEVAGFAPGAPTCELPWLSPCAASALHVYQYGGTYNITLTVTDVAGNKTSVSHTVTVDGPPAPSAATPSSGSTGASSATPTASSTPSSSKGAAAGASVTVPAPLAQAAIVRQSLHHAARSGLTVDYSVNEQVAGHFEVLLSSATAHKLGISGALAVGLPAGSPAEVVIAKAILVTTKGGHSAVHIAFSSRTDARLARAHKVSLMLRLIVRNAASVHPLTTTVVSSATLSA